MALDIYNDAFEGGVALGTPREETDKRVVLCLENRFAQFPSPLDFESFTTSDFVDVGQFMELTAHVSQPSEDETRRSPELRQVPTATTKRRRT